MGLKDVLYPPPPTTILSGIHLDVKIADLHGWTMFFSKPYSHPTRIGDFTPPEDCPGNALIVGARWAGSDTLALAAMGLAEVITASTEDDATHLHNGVWWYCRPAYSIGFAPNSVVDLSLADVSHEECPYRLSWRLRGS